MQLTFYAKQHMVCFVITNNRLPAGLFQALGFVRAGGFAFDARIGHHPKL